MIISIFKSVPDHRVVGRCMYPLSDLLTIALLTYLCNGEDYTDMSSFAETRARDFGLLQGCVMSPSPDTFERLMKAVDPSEIERCLVTYGKQFLDTCVEKQIAIDGKKLRGTQPKSRGTNGDYLLNAFVCENQMVIGQLPVKDKENEITAIPMMLDKLEIAGATVTIDAIGTQVSIAQKIVDKGAHYMLAVKDNQKFTNEAMSDVFLHHVSQIKDTYEEKNIGHDRIETRTCRILDAKVLNGSVDGVENKWPQLKTLVEITSSVCYDAEREEVKTIRHYISDDSFPKARYYYQLARGHWTIENNLHWHLDITFGEDNCRARTKNAPQNLSLIRKMALQIVKNHIDTGKKRSLKKRLFLASLSADYLLQIIKNAKF